MASYVACSTANAGLPFCLRDTHNTRITRQSLVRGEGGRTEEKKIIILGERRERERERKKKERVERDGVILHTKLGAVRTGMPFGVRSVVLDNVRQR